MARTTLITRDLLAKLERLEVAFRRAQRGRPDGERSGTHHGGRIEFADYRDYSPGDDFRYVDWNVLSRTDDLVVKQFAREEQYLIYLLLDRSASMGCSATSGLTGKLDYGAACLAALAYLGLAGGHRVELCAFADGRCDWFPAGADKSGIFGLLDRLAALRPGGTTCLDLALEEAYSRARDRCCVIAISDLFDADAAQRPLAALAAKGLDLSLVHVLAPDEVHPTLRGRVRLRDAETGQALSLRLTDVAVTGYRDALRDFGERWAAFCGKHDIRFLATTTDVPFEDFVMRYLRRGGLIR